MHALIRSRRAATAAVTLGLCLVPALAGAQPDVRLGDDVAPISQQVRLTLDPNTAGYSGSVRVELEVRRATPIVRLHADAMELVRVHLAAGRRAVPVQSAIERDVVTLTAAKPLAPGRYALEVDFRQEYNTRATSLYRMLSGADGYLFTQFEPTGAREAFPCWDEPAFKIPFTFTLEVPVGQEVLFNTPVERESGKPGWRVIEFERTPPMPTYLLALAAGKLEFTPVPGMRVPTRIVHLPGQSHMTALAAEMTPPILDALEAWFGMPYPYAKNDFIAVPEYWAGAMENPGAITFRDNILLLDPNTATPAQRRNLARIIAHELAHIWFGDLVTMAWWDDLWLNESFADWLGDKMTEQLYPELGLRHAEIVNIDETMTEDARPSTREIRRPVENAGLVFQNVGLAYDKGKSVLAMFEAWTGAEEFRRGVQAYLRAHEWGNATAADLWKALGAASGRNVPAVMAGFLEQPGIPLVRIESVEGNRVTLSQRRFLHAGVEAEPQAWKIPVGLRWSDGGAPRSRIVLLDAERQTVTLEGGPNVAWVMPHLDARGYYRWSVPGPMLVELSKRASEALDPAERIGFLGNLQALLMAGEVRGDDLLRVLESFGRDPDPQVVSALLNQLGTVRATLVTDDQREAFGAWVGRVLAPAAERFGLEKRAGEPDKVGMLRGPLLTWLGVRAADPAARLVAAGAIKRILSDVPLADPSIASSSLQIAAVTGDRELFDAYVAKLETTKNPAVRGYLVSAIGRFDDLALEDAALAYALSGKLRPNEFGAVAGAVGSKSEAGADKSFAWMREHFDAIRSRVPPEVIPFLVRACGGCSAERLAIGRAFFLDPARVAPGVERALTEVADGVEDCLRLREREGAAVAAYLGRTTGAK